MNAIAGLKESDPQIQSYALKHINSDVNETWSQASLLLGTIEQLYEEPTFPNRELAALVASKIYYHLAVYEDALHFALGSGSLFDVSETSDYVCCIVGKCLDKYTKLRQAGETPEPKLEKMYNAVVDSWSASKDVGQLKEVIGLTIGSRRLDLLERALKQILDTEQGKGLLKYCLDMAIQHVYDREFRQNVLKLLVVLFQSEQYGPPDYINAMHCWILTNEPSEVSKMTLDLLSKKDEAMDDLAYNIGFELYANCPPAFCKAIIDTLAESDVKDLDSAKKVTHILSGKVTSELHLHFLYDQNQADVSILINMKKTIESRSTVLSNSLVIANSLMYCGTSVDAFLRDNLDWLGRFTNWAKFTATASLGLIHRGHVKKSLDLLAPYLTSAAGGVSSPYEEGGALYALGLIHSPVCHDNAVSGEPVSGNPQNQGQGEQQDQQQQPQQQGQQQIINYLTDAIRNAQQNEQILHGACLGLGLTAMTLADEVICTQLKDLLNMDSAVVGEAAALGIGMVMLGSADKEICQELMEYGQETQHEKITRGIAMALSLIMYNREDEADTLIETLCSHKDAIFRCGGVFVIAMAYAGTANSGAIERLLNMAVTDVSDEVRRYAIAFLGFLTFKKPKYCIDLVRLLSDSYNPHTRYGVAMAIGIACAGTNLKDAVEILERLAKDSVDYIRQMAFISLAMVMIHQPKGSEKVDALRKTLDERIKDKHEELMTKFGCIVATGILDAGGRNITIALHKNNHNLMKSIVGMCVFTQYWYWYSYLLLLSLTFHPVTDQCDSEEYKQPIHKWELKDTPIGTGAAEGDEDKEPDPPEPFEWP
jgi:26S proteasome regulatory subunit N2